MQHYYLLLHFMNFKQLEQYFIKETAELYSADESKPLFEMIIEQLTGWRRSALLMRREEEISGEQHTNFTMVLEQIKRGVPVQHIFSEAWFYGLKFKVNGSVLIPRPETEELVEWILNDLETMVSGTKGNCDPAGIRTRILDIGTGSGCIAITLQHKCTDAETYAMDISEEALATAKENARLHDAPVSFIHGDILRVDNDPAGIRTFSYDVIVSNPPYIKEDERLEMHQNVLDHEPHLALFVTNENPLIFYKAIADYALKYLRKTGRLYFEINEYLGQETVEMLNAKGFINIILKKDMQGKDRMIRCELHKGN